VDKEGIRIDDCCVVGSSPLEIFGIRKSTDIDIIIDPFVRRNLFHDDVVNLSNNVDIVCKGYHRSQEKEKIFSDEQIIHDVDKHFYFRGLKFANLEIVRDRKNWHKRPKDLKDVRLIDRFLAPKFNIFKRFAQKRKREHRS